MIVDFEGVKKAQGSLIVDLSDGTSSSLNFTAEAGENSQKFQLQMTSPKLWWPLGYGQQPLYNLTVRLCDLNGAVQSQKSTNFAFRTVRLNNDQQGEDSKFESEFSRQKITGSGNLFVFEVNGLKILGRGANWCPPDMFQERADRTVVDRLLYSAAAANMNMLRVW